MIQLRSTFIANTVPDKMSAVPRPVTWYAMPKSPLEAYFVSGSSGIAQYSVRSAIPCNTVAVEEVPSIGVGILTEERAAHLPNAPTVIDGIRSPIRRPL